MADTTLNLILILVFLIAAVLVLGWQAEDTHRVARSSFVEAVKSRLAGPLQPEFYDYTWRNDPPGAQRWVFERVTLFERGTADLTVEGRQALSAFGDLLAEHSSAWRRVRIEGHTLPTPQKTRDKWALATDRAATVAALFASQRCAIPAFYLATAGRGGQTALSLRNPSNPSERVKLLPDDRRHERVEIVLEYAGKSAEAIKCAPK